MSALFILLGLLVLLGLFLLNEVQPFKSEFKKIDIPRLTKKNYIWTKGDKSYSYKLDHTVLFYPVIKIQVINAKKVVFELVQYPHRQYVRVGEGEFKSLEYEPELRKEVERFLTPFFKAMKEAQIILDNETTQAYNKELADIKRFLTEKGG